MFIPELSDASRRSRPQAVDLSRFEGNLSGRFTLDGRAMGKVEILDQHPARPAPDVPADVSESVSTAFREAEECFVNGQFSAAVAFYAKAVDRAATGLLDGEDVSRLTLGQKIHKLETTKRLPAGMEDWIRLINETRKQALHGADEDVATAADALPTRNLTRALLICTSTPFPPWSSGLWIDTIRPEVRAARTSSGLPVSIEGERMDLMTNKGAVPVGDLKTGQDQRASDPVGIEAARDLGHDEGHDDAADSLALGRLPQCIPKHRRRTRIGWPKRGTALGGDDRHHAASFGSDAGDEGAGRGMSEGQGVSAGQWSESHWVTRT